MSLVLDSHELQIESRIDVELYLLGRLDSQILRWITLAIVPCIYLFLSLSLLEKSLRVILSGSFFTYNLY